MYSKIISFFVFFLLNIAAIAQFPGETKGFDKGIFKDSSIIQAWATECKVVRGFVNIADPALGFTTVGNEASAVGPAGENGVISLGDGGEAVLTFAQPISDHEGYDLAVFENSFDGNFLELAFVEVSSDGINFYRFPPISLIDTTKQVGTFDPTDPRKINNLAGKHEGLFGTPFDLAELKNVVGLDIGKVTHVKIKDAVGSLDDKYATRDTKGVKMNDPWPTPFPSGGFDLDAVAVLRSPVNTVKGEALEGNYKVHPNPLVAGQILNIDLSQINLKDFEVSLTNTLGKVLFQSTTKDQFQIETTGFEKGLHYLLVSSAQDQHCYKIVIQ